VKHACNALKRRQFITLFAAGLVATTLPVAVAAAPNEWDDFVARVHARVTEIVRREGRGVKKMWIEPPRAGGVRYTRRVHIELEPGPSLLDRLHFEFVEVSGSRLMWDGDSI
jgi:hypothetical protein